MNNYPISLKLFEIFEALLAKKSVSLAAEMVRLSQPSVSRSLKELREIFKDPLFIRTRQGLMPTSRALELSPLTRQILELTEETRQPRASFEPQKAEGTIRVAATDYVEFLILPPLANLLTRLSPNLHLEMVPLAQKIPFRELEEGEIELAIGYFPDAPSSLYRQDLFEEDFVSTVGPGFPVKEKGLTLDDFVSHRHLLVAPWGGMQGLIDPILEKKNLRRHIYVSTTRFLTAPWAVTTSSYIVTLPRRLAVTFSKQIPLNFYESPVELPRFRISQIWHPRSHNEPLCQWFRNQIFQMFS